MEGARAARGTVVVIDVIRAFSVSAYALAAGARECRPVGEVGEALELARRIPGAVVSAEVDGLPVPGISISNSPTMIRDLDLRGRVLIQRTSAGTQSLLAVPRRSVDRLFAASLVVAAATARAVAQENPGLVSLVAAGATEGHTEDSACSRYLAALLLGERPDLPTLISPLFASKRYQELAAGGRPGFPPADLELSLRADVFDFAMPAERDEKGLRLNALPC